MKVVAVGCSSILISIAYTYSVLRVRLYGVHPVGRRRVRRRVDDDGLCDSVHDDDIIARL